MKKYLSLFGALALGTTTTLTVVACGDPTNPTPIPTPGNENTGIWSNQTSNIAKALILGKNENFNTNRLLNSALNNNQNNILKNEDNSTGENYANFKKVWGYNENIEGVTESQFNSNGASTVDNNLLWTKDQISGTLDSILNLKNLIKSFLTPFTNTSLKSVLRLGQSLLLSTIFDLKDDDTTTNMLKQLVPMIASTLNNLNGFDAEKTFGEDFYKDDIAKSLFGENGNDGWLSKYETSTGFKSEALTKKSTSLKAENFKTWDQVALFKNSIDLNGFFYQLSGEKKLTLGDIFNNSIKNNEFDINEFMNQIQSIFNPSAENIVNLISVLIPIVKSQLLGFNPTDSLTKISTTENTNPSEGILNVNDLMSELENILFNKDGFTKFITDLFIAHNDGNFKPGNYATFDLTCGDKTLSEALLPIKDDFNKKITTLYTELIESIMKENYIQDIFNNLKEYLASGAKLEINITEIQTILNAIAENISPFLDNLKSFENEEDMSNHWLDVWTPLGLQSGEEFAAGSAFEKIANVINGNPNFWDNLFDILTFANKAIGDSINILATKMPTTNLDFNNEKLWSVDKETIEYIYDKKTNKSTITYNLIDKTKVDPVTYKVSVVVSGDTNAEIGKDPSQVWLKSLIKA